MKRVFIVNPASGDGKAVEIADKIKELLDGNEEYDMYYTSYPREAIDIAKKYKSEKEVHIIYSVGGDGTLFEVVNGIADSNNLLGIIPAGTGNDFIKVLDSNTDITYVDLCKLNDYYFVNIASVGLDADICKNKEKMKKLHIPKSLQYIASAFSTFIKYKSKRVKIIINDKEYNQEITLIAICNGKYYGGGLKIAPNAIYNDGLFDIYLADKTKKIKLPRLFLKLIQGKHQGLKIVKELQSNKVIIDSNTNINCNVDGEILNLKHIEFKVTDHKLSIYTKDDLIKDLCKKEKLIK